MLWFNIYRARLLSFPSSEEDCSSCVLSVSFEHISELFGEHYSYAGSVELLRNILLSLFICYNKLSARSSLFNLKGRNAGLGASATGNRCDLCFGGKNGDEMGRNSVSAFICNIGAWGHMGRDRVSPLEMGIKGGVGYQGSPRLRSRRDRKTAQPQGHEEARRWKEEGDVSKSDGKYPED
jgi:hypothetical protein